MVIGVKMKENPFTNEIRHTAYSAGREIAKSAIGNIEDTDYESEDEIRDIEQSVYDEIDESCKAIERYQGDTPLEIYGALMSYFGENKIKECGCDDTIELHIRGDVTGQLYDEADKIKYILEFQY